jgi:hypothetical protein
MAETISVNSRVIASQGQVHYKTGNEVVVFNSESGVYYGLDNAGARVWELLQESRSPAQIGEILSAEYQVTQQRCEEDLLTMLQDMANAGLILINN